LHYDEGSSGTVMPYVAVAIGEQPWRDTDEVEEAVLPPYEAAVTVYEGTGIHELIGPIYQQLVRYADLHGYAATGPGRDHLIRSDGDQVVVELRMPVESR
jgi:effector-binding domain-containing protein